MSNDLKSYTEALEALNTTLRTQNFFEEGMSYELTSTPRPNGQPKYFFRFSFNSSDKTVEESLLIQKFAQTLQSNQLKEILRELS